MKPICPENNQPCDKDDYCDNCADRLIYCPGCELNTLPDEGNDDKKEAADGNRPGCDRPVREIACAEAGGLHCAEKRRRKAPDRGRGEISELAQIKPDKV